MIGHIGVIQRNAIGSWLQLKPKPQVLLFGNEEGVAGVAAEFGIEHVPDISRNEFGTPLLDDVFTKFERRAAHAQLCYSNCDIILFQDVSDAVAAVQKRFPEFLFVAECMNMDKRDAIDFSHPAWERALSAEMEERGTRRAEASDFFFFMRGMYPQYLPLALGRPYFDNWIIYDARRRHVPVVNGSGSVSAIHQNHFYSAVPGEKTGQHSGIEAKINLETIGSRDCVYWLTDCTHRYVRGHVRRSVTGTMLVRERAMAFQRKLRKVFFFCSCPLKSVLRNLGML